MALTYFLPPVKTTYLFTENLVFALSLAISRLPRSSKLTSTPHSASAPVTADHSRPEEGSLFLFNPGPRRRRPKPSRNPPSPFELEIINLHTVPYLPALCIYLPSTYFTYPTTLPACSLLSSFNTLTWKLEFWRLEPKLPTLLPLRNDKFASPSLPLPECLYNFNALGRSNISSHSPVSTSNVSLRDAKQPPREIVRPLTVSTV